MEITDSRVQDTFELLLHEWRSELDHRLTHLLESDKPPVLYEPIRYVLVGGGKRIRPVLLLLACQAVGGDISQAWDAAVAVELLHDFTLVHDDIMDNDDTRRGRATVHKEWTSDIAILAGDGIFALAYRVLLRTQSPRIQDVLTVFTDGILAVCEGQALDLEFETRPSVSLDDYMEMIGKKTARLMQVSTRVGALVGGGSDVSATALGRFAQHLGLAFQIQDDLLDFMSDEETLGKTYASDIRQKKQTYLMVHALSSSNQNAAQRLRALISAETSGSKVDEVVELFEESGSIQAARQAISEQVAAAKECLSVITQSREKDFLLQLLSYISKRNS